MNRSINRRMALGIFVSLALAASSAVGEESSTMWEWVLPDEGKLYNLSENVQIKFTGPTNVAYSMKISRVGSNAQPYETTGTMSSGQSEHSITATQFGVGDYVIQIREGSNNYSGSTVLTRSFTIEESQ